MNARHTFCVGALVALCAASNAASFVSVFVPNSLENTDGNNATVAPFSIGADTIRYQQVYGASEFLGLAPFGGDITVISFRDDIVFGGSFDKELPNIEIRLSTTTRGPDTLSSDFSENRGSDETIVLGPGPLAVDGARGAIVGINLAHRFSYNPQAGNLLMEVVNVGGGTTTAFDAVNVQGDSVSRVFALGSSGNRPVIDSARLVTDFIIIPVPEPNTLGLGLALAGWRILRKRARDGS